MNEVVQIETAEVITPHPATPMEMIARAISNNASVEVLERLLALQERWEANNGRRAYDSAIASAKAKFPPILKNRTVDFTSQKGRTNYSHEDLAGIAKTIDPILSEFGLSYRFMTSQDAGLVRVTCIIAHRDGYREETSLCGTPDLSGNKNSNQAVGSTVTYLQRYTLKAALGLAASQDDDGRHGQNDKRIDADQYVAINNLIEKTDADVPRLLAYLGATNIEELTLSQFDTAMKALRKKQAQGDSK